MNRKKVFIPLKYLALISLLSLLVACPENPNLINAPTQIESFKFQGQTEEVRTLEIEPGESVTLEWQAINATACFMSENPPVPPSVRTVACEAVSVVSPRVNTRYQLNAEKPDGTFITKDLVISLKDTAVTLAVQKIGTGSGLVSSNPAGIDCGKTCSASFTEGSEVTLTAIPDSVSTIEGWGGICAGSSGNTCIGTITSDATVSVDFKGPNSIRLTVSKLGTGTGTVTSTPAGIDCGNTCTGDFPEGTEVTLKAVADSDSTLIGWGEACATSSDDTCILTLSNDSSVVADFKGPAQIQKLRAADGAEGDYFGASVAISGTTAVIGAPLDDDEKENSGSAYVFTLRRDGTWRQQAKLNPDPEDVTKDGWFGNSVAIDGDTAIIGAYNAGAAYVFIRQGESWSRQQTLLPDAATSFGVSVDISGDTVIIGGGKGDVGNAGPEGPSYIFTRSGTTWTQEEKLTVSGGFSVAIDGDLAVVADHFDGEKADKAGAAYVFTRSGEAWIQEDKLSADDGAKDHEFGRLLDLDNNTIIIGAGGSSSSYVFERTGGIWIQQDKLPSSGRPVTIHDDTIVASSYPNGSTVELFIKNNTGGWVSQGQLTPGDNPGTFGFSVEAGESNVIIGAVTDNDRGKNSGSAYIFRR